MSKLTESLAKEYLEEEEKKVEKIKKIQEEWEPLNKLRKKLNEIISELGEYYFLFNKLTKEEESKFNELIVCERALRDGRPWDSEYMEKLHAVVQEAWDFLGKIRIKYGNIQSIRCRQEWLTAIGILIGFFAFCGFCAWLAFH